MTGPLIEFLIRQVNPLDKNIVAVRYDIQTAFPGPVSLNTGPYVYRESKTDMMSRERLFNNTSITQTLAYGSTFTSAVQVNFQDVNSEEITFFYDRAYQNAQAYFANVYGTQSIKGYTGSMLFSGSGISGSLYK